MFDLIARFLGIYYLLNVGLGLIALCRALLFSDYYLFIGCRLHFCYLFWLFLDVDSLIFIVA